MFKVLVLAFLTVAPLQFYQAYYAEKTVVLKKYVPVFMGAMGMWVALGSLLGLYAAYRYAVGGNLYSFEFDWLNVSIICSYGFGLFLTYYRVNLEGN